MDTQKIDLSNLTAEEVRKNMPAFREAMQSLGSYSKVGMTYSVSEVKDIQVTYEDHEVPVKIYYPDSESVLPVLFTIHGGGFVGGSYIEDEPLARLFSHKVNCIVVSIDYTLAPECTWPTPPEECYAVMKFIADHAAEYRADIERYAVYGGSAGANYAAACCHMAAQRGDFSIRYAALVYPPIDISIDPVDRVTPFTDNSLQTPEMAGIFDAFYAPDPATRKDPTVSPTYGDLSKFPPTCVISAYKDPLMPGQRAFVEKLIDAGIEVMYKCYTDVTHGFVHMEGTEEYTLEVHEMIATQLNRALK